MSSTTVRSSEPISLNTILSKNRLSLSDILKIDRIKEDISNIYNNDVERHVFILSLVNVYKHIVISKAFKK